jgi:uncharacterized membrane protein HdeD (DUF308 family)
MNPVGSREGMTVDTTTSTPTGKPLFLANLTSVMPIKPVWLVVFGALLTVLGVYALASVMTATIVSVYFVAISMVVAGTAQIALGLQSRSPRGATTWVLLGLLYLGAGLLAFFNPLLAAGVLTLLLGTSLVAGGLIRLLLSL